ncbi:bifunctional DNA primase/polymerase [Acetobacter sacchari]|uniref:Bifunctional DNA primase/polymerase n=1 Tax=Acetobacter sacchari TaxID=2661687 RepID=A0ABS3M0W9_9PROT|nr:bifunctional DNA primase/polymerase [Acetobacter sacchari]MBO1361799.1 bifunctional DNA primase/polymerase [Acetobacter sacchari]
MRPLTPNEALECAIQLARGGLHVFPCNTKKMPSWPKSKGGKGFHDATTDVGALTDIWRAWPGSLIGVRTGAASDLSVLDLDLQHETAREWVDQFGDLLGSYRTNLTRSGGKHVLFRHAEGVTNSAGKIAKNVDVRGEGGYIIWWPACGLGQINADEPLVEFPKWLSALGKKEERRERREEKPKKLTDRYVGSAIERAYETVAMAPEGQRNDTLNRQTYSLARFIHDGALSSADVIHAMSAAGSIAGLDDREIEATINSALRARSLNNG